MGLKRPFDRIDLEDYSNHNFVWYSDQESKDKENAMYRKEYALLTEGYETDIKNIIGTYKDYLFISVQSENKKILLIDVISPKYEFYTQIEINDPDLFIINSLKMLHKITARIIDNKLILYCKNDELGPFAIVYDIKIN